MIYIRSILFYLIFVPYSFGIAFFVLLARPFGKGPAWKLSMYWGFVAQFLLRNICGVRTKVEGLEHVPDEPCVVVVKHQSTWETAVLPQYLPPFAWVLKKELTHVPLFGWALHAVGAIAIVRSNPREALKQVNDKGIANLQNGRSVVIFPEGTRTAVGEKGNYQPSAIMLAKKAEVAILPVAHNSGVCWPKGTILKHPGTITVRFLPVIPVEEVKEKKRNVLLAECEESIEAACGEIGR